MKIVNLTQHASSPEQKEAGVVDTTSNISGLLTFDEAPSAEEMTKRAVVLARICQEMGGTSAMIGGAPFFMSTLERVLKMNGIEPVYAFSKRESVESVNEDGSVRKINVFRHVGFVAV